MEDFNNTFEYLAMPLKRIFKTFCGRVTLMEIRLRVDRPLEIKTRNGCFYLGEDGQVRDVHRAYIVTMKDIKDTLEYVSNFSLYAYEDEIRNGYITMKGGNRIGLCGKAVIEKGVIKNIRNISSMNIRISHEFKGCADGIVDYIYDGRRIYNTLIISPPGCGKTTVLRDIVRQLSDGNEQKKGVNVGVVDERSEIAACNFGVPQNDVGVRTDVLDGCPKSEGMMMLIRSMSPRVVAVDEIGSADDAGAILAAINSGSAIIATIHGGSVEEYMNKISLSELVKNNVFERIICLSDSKGPGTVEGIYGARGEVIVCH